MRTIKTILVPTDFSEPSARAAREALVLARSCGAAVILLHVMDLNAHTPTTEPAEPEKLRKRLLQESGEQLNETILQLSNEKVEVRGAILEGLPAEIICDAALRSDLIIMGKGKPKPFWHWFSRQTVAAVLEQAPCPVLVVGEPRPER